MKNPVPSVEVHGRSHYKDGQLGCYTLTTQCNDLCPTAISGGMRWDDLLLWPKLSQASGGSGHNPSSDVLPTANHVHWRRCGVPAGFSRMGLACGGENPKRDAGGKHQHRHNCDHH